MRRPFEHKNEAGARKIRTQVGKSNDEDSI